MNRVILALGLLAVGCPPAADDDDSAPDVVLIDDDDGDDDDATDAGTPVSVPGSFLSDCPEVEPNDAPVLPGETLTLDPPWDDATDCGDLPSGAGAVLGMTGRISAILQGSWEGDNDAFTFVTSEEISPRVVVQWDPLVGDLDARLWCAAQFGQEDAAGGGLATVNRPEQIATTAFAIPAGTRCTFFVVAYEGAVVDYVAWLEVD
jgi:hypothetical protein